MNRSCWVAGIAIAAVAAQAGAQSFGTITRSKVTLQRKLPALIHLTGTTIRVRVTAHENQADLAHDLQALLETELLKDDSTLREDETSPAVTITCQITNFAHPQPTVTTRPALATNKNAPKSQTFTRVTGSLSVSFQAKTSAGRVLGSENVTANYDQEFDSAGNNTSHGVLGTMGSSIKRLKGGSGSDNEDNSPPTDAELRSKLLNQAVQQMAQQIVNTNETIQVELARKSGALDEGDKQAEAGLWQRALETWETAPPLPKKEDDAYRLYDIGVGYEALAYAADNPQSAMKFLDQAAINYGKAVDDKPGEKNFLEPQKRIETAIAHYRKLAEEKNAPAETAEGGGAPAVAKPASSSAAPTGEEAPAPKKSSRAITAKNSPPATSKSASHAGSHALTNAQVVAMVKAGMDDDTVAKTVHAAASVDFDMSSAARANLARSGVGPVVIKAMRERAAEELAKEQ